MKVYLIPGLGFDHRIFEKLDLRDTEFEYLNWIEPKVEESIKEYANRLSSGMDKSVKEIILIGHSFGGIIAQEISAIRKVDKIILISSIKSRRELPLYFKLMKPFQIHKLFTKELTARTIQYWGKNYDYESAEEQQLVSDMVDTHSNNYLQWALKELSVWDKPELDPSTKTFQIHGELDKTFPLKLIQKPDWVIENSGHFVVYKRPIIMNEIIAGELS